MKTLYLVRHAKSSWKKPELSDHDRPLNRRGKKDAPKIGKLLRERGDIPDLIITSPAKRAFSTAIRIAGELGYPPKKILKNGDLYMADDREFFSVIAGVKSKVKKLMLFGHNYGITFFANHITSMNIPNIPTSGVVRIDFDIKKWKDIQDTKGKLIYFEYPKKTGDGV